MKILGIDTSSKRCSVCILEDTKTIMELHSDDEKTHSQKLMPLIDELFKTSNLSLDNINLLACSIGPGSFTGIRIGITTAKAFSDAKDIIKAGISSLEGLAYNVADIIENNNINLICPIIDAKNDNVYYSLFDKEYNQVEGFIACSIDDLILDLQKYNGNIIFVGDGSVLYKENLKSLENINPIFANDEKNLASSISIAKSAYNKYIHNKYDSSLSPMYLRKSQAERSLDIKIKN